MWDRMRVFGAGVWGQFKDFWRFFWVAFYLFWRFFWVAVFYVLWSVIALGTIAAMLVEVKDVSLAAFGWGAAFVRAMFSVVGDNGLAVFLIELCGFVVHAYAWKIDAVKEVVAQLSVPVKNLFRDRGASRNKDDV